MGFIQFTWESNLFFQRAAYGADQSNLVRSSGGRWRSFSVVQRESTFSPLDIFGGLSSIPLKDTYPPTNMEVRKAPSKKSDLLVLSRECRNEHRHSLKPTSWDGFLGVIPCLIPCIFRSSRHTYPFYEAFLCTTSRL